LTSTATALLCSATVAGVAAVAAEWSERPLGRAAFTYTADLRGGACL